MARRTKRNRELRSCLGCGEWFWPHRNVDTCCSSECRALVVKYQRYTIHTCSACGKRWLGKRSARSECSKRCFYRAKYAERKGPPKRRDGSVVYFVQADRGGPIKVGTTSRMKDCLWALQRGNPSPLKVLATLPGGRDEEVAVHRRIERFRVLNEWFEPVPEVYAAAGLVAPLRLVI